MNNLDGDGCENRVLARQERSGALEAVYEQIRAPTQAAGPAATIVINLIGAGQGGQLLAAPSDGWMATNDSKEDYGNDLLLELAKAIIAGEQMGKGNNTDFLAVSFSSTDYVGHAFGTHSWDLLDTYVRLDETLGKLFSYLDKTVGKDQYTVFLSADHAAPHIPAFLQKNWLLSASWDDGEIKKDLTDFSTQQFNGLNLVSNEGSSSFLTLYSDSVAGSRYEES